MPETDRPGPGGDHAWSATARRAWMLVETVHDVYYFSPDLRPTTDAAGLRGYWMAYFATRAAPMGAVPAEVVEATFYGFHSSLVHRAIPEAWRRVTAAQALDLRARVVDIAMRAVLGPDVATDPAIADAAGLGWAAAQACEVAGRPLGAANRALPRPDAPHLALWQATSTLREHRGDAHVAALLAHGVGPAESHVLKAAAGESPRELLRNRRGFPPEEWAAAEAGLQARGWLADGVLTDAGAAVHGAVEAATDAASTTPWRMLGERDTARLLDLLVAPARAVVGSGMLPVPHPVGFDPRAI